MAEYKHFRVGVNDWAYGQERAVLETRYLTLCSGVAVYDARNQIGHMLHVAGVMQQTDYIDEFFDSISQTMSRPSSLRLWARGNCGPLASVAAGRTYIVARSREIGIPEESMSLRWAGCPATDMLLDCQSGLFHAAPSASENPDGHIFAAAYLEKIQQAGHTVVEAYERPYYGITE